MKDCIKVKCIMGYKQFRNDEDKTLLAVVEEGKIYKANLYELTGEYFANDSEGREFLVAELNANDELILNPEFELTNLISLTDNINY